MDELISREDRKFFEYHRNNPKIYDLFVEFAREAKKAGFKQYSIWAVMNRVRWHVDIITIDTPAFGKERFKISNGYAARYSRLIMKQESDLKEFFRIKQMKSKTCLDENN